MATDVNTAPQSAPEKKQRRRRRWLWFIPSFILILVLGVILTPTLLSTPPGRNFLVARINGRIPGTLEVAGLSVGWFSPTLITDLKLADPDGKPIIHLRNLHTELTLLRALRGQFHLGQTNIHIESIHVECDTMGVTNLERALNKTTASKTQNSSASTMRHSDSNREKTANKLMNASGNISLTIERTSWKDPQSTVNATPTTASFKFDTAGLPAEISLQTDIQATDATPASMTFSGTADVFHRQRIRPVHEMKFQGTAVIKQLHLGSLKGLLTSMGMTTLADGLLDATLNFDTTQTTTLARGEIRLIDFAITGPTIKGDTLKLNCIDVPLDVQLQSDGLKIRKLDAIIAPSATDLVNKPDLALHIARNSVINWAGDSNNITIQMDYDLARLSAILKNYIPADFSATGKYATQFKITGPLSPESGVHQLRQLQIAPTKIGFDQILYDGFDLGKSEISLALADGILTLGPSRIPANNGEMNLAGTINLNTSPMSYQLNAPLEFAKGVQMNKQIAAGALAFLPIAWGLDQNNTQLLDARGGINIRIDRANLPLANADLQKSGTLSGVLSIESFTSNSPIVNEVLTKIGPLAKITQTNWSLQPQNIQDVAFALNSGRISYKDFTLHAGSANFAFSGQAGLDKTLDMTLNVNESKLNLAVPVTIRGTMSKPKITVSQEAIQKTIQQSVPGLIENLLNQRKRDKEK